MELERVKCKQCGRSICVPVGVKWPICYECSRRNNISGEVHSLHHYEATRSDKNKRLTIILCCLGFIGAGGMHDFYLGHYARAGVKMLTANWFLIGTIVDLIKICQNKYRDAENKFVRA